MVKVYALFALWRSQSKQTDPGYPGAELMILRLCAVFFFWGGGGDASIQIDYIHG